MSWLLFFDGECAFCSRSVRWIVRVDRAARISFAPLQGETARRLGLSHHAAVDGGSVVLLREEDGKIFTESDAVLGMAQALGGGWRVLGVLRFIPRFLRDGCYRWIARNRLRWFGRADACSLPGPKLLARLRD